MSLSPYLVNPAFETSDGEPCLKTRFCDVTLLLQGLQPGMPDDPFEHVLCREANLGGVTGGITDAVGSVVNRASRSSLATNAIGCPEQRLTQHHGA